MQTILQSTLATSTNRNYHSVFNAYISFCRSQNLNIIEKTVVLWFANKTNLLTGLNPI